jgi:hypothetical protein
VIADDGVVVVRRKHAADVVTQGEKRHADEEGKRKQSASGMLGLDIHNMREALATGPVSRPRIHDKLQNRGRVDLAGELGP